MRTLNILHVEDDDNDAFFVERAVTSSRFQVCLRRVADGEDALDYLNGVGRYADRTQFPLPQIMLLDLKLPLRDGFEVLAWARQQPQFHDLPIVVLSSSSEPKDTARAEKLGATGYVVKMIGFKNLISQISKFLDAQETNP